MKNLNRKPPAAESEPAAPRDLRSALADAPIANARWSELTTIGRMDFISWINGAKQPETRRRRIERACEMLAAGKRRPCCFSVVPLDLHLALKASPAAKAAWGGLGSIARRDCIAWIDLAEGREPRKRRVAQACALLAAGKRCPPKP